MFVQKAGGASYMLKDADTASCTRSVGEFGPQHNSFAALSF